METEAGEKQNVMAAAKATVQECTATIDQAQADLADAQQFLQQLAADRAKFQQEFDERNKLRQSERAATQAALDALQSISVSNTAIPALVQGGVEVTAGSSHLVPLSFVQVAAKARGAADGLEAAGFDMQSPAMAMVNLALQQQGIQQPEGGGYMDTE